MAGVSIPGAKGGRKFDVEVNLVAFIDMMSCLLAFLMLSAVWNNLAKIDIDEVIPKVQQDPTQVTPPKVTRLQLLVDSSGYVVNMKDGDTETKPVVLPIIDGKLPREKLEEALAELKKGLPLDKDGKQTKAILLLGRNRVRYEEIVVAMDVCIGLELTGFQLGDSDDAAPSLIQALKGKG